jgi:hypothetical protein
VSEEMAVVFCSASKRDREERPRAESSRSIRNAFILCDDEEVSCRPAGG